MANVFPNTLVTGASGGIGEALVRALLASAGTERVYATWHDPDHAKGLAELAEAHPGRLLAMQVDCCDPGSISRMVQRIEVDSQRLHLAINCVGFLHRDGIEPEKHLGQVHADHLLESFRVNSLPTLLLAQALQPLFRHRQPSVLAAISARVGSIGDNRLGGWYGYRASKAALNMYIRTIAIEYRRTCPETRVIALHPGTVDTALSEPFQSGVPTGKLFTPERSATHLLEVIDRLDEDSSGRFYAWDGQEIPW